MNHPVARREPGHETLSFDDFDELLLDKPDDEKWELISGRMIRGMVGARIEHHHIIDNVGTALSTHLRTVGRLCRVYRETFYLKERKDNLSALPDIMVRCGPIPPGATSIDDPLILIEVVSPGTEARDRLDKRIAYQALPSLQTYVLIERDRILIDVYQRTARGFVSVEPLKDLSECLVLPAIEFEMTLADIYRDVIGK